MDQPQSTSKFAKLTSSVHTGISVGPSSARIASNTQYKGQAFMVQPKLEVGKQSNQMMRGSGAPMSMRSTSMGFSAGQYAPAGANSYKPSPRAASPRFSANHMSMLSNESMVKESALFNHNLQYQLQKDHQLRVREMQLRKKYEGIDTNQLKLLLPSHETPFAFRTSPLMTPLQEPLSNDALQKQTYSEMFHSLGQKKQMNYVNMSMERYNLINHKELSTTVNKEDPQAVYHSNFFDKRVNYDSQKLTLKDTNISKPQLTQHFNILAAKRLNDPAKRQEVQDNRKAVSMSKRYHIIRNIQDLKQKSQMNHEEKRQSSTQQEVSSMEKVLMKRNPGDPIINSRRPFQVSNFMNVYDNLHQRIQDSNLTPDLPTLSNENDENQKSKVIFHRRANTSLQLQAPDAAFPLNRSQLNPLPSKREHHVDFIPHISTTRPGSQDQRITFKALRKLTQQKPQDNDGHPIDEIEDNPPQELDKDRLSEILDSLKPTKNIHGLSGIVDSSIDHMKKMAVFKNSPIHEKIPLIQSDAAMSKRLKNLEEFINQKKRVRDREDAMSVASQVLDHISKGGDGRSQSSMGFNKQTFKRLDINQVNKALPQPIGTSRAAGNIATITEEKASARNCELTKYTENDLTIDDEYLLKMNSGRGGISALISTNRRSPRYLGDYDIIESGDEEKQDITVQLTARKEKAKHQKSKGTLKKIK